VSEPATTPEDAAASRRNLVETVNHTLEQEMHRDDGVRLMGYDVGPIGGVYRATEGLLETFGEDRVIDTPLSENGILGTAVGMAMRGERVVPEIQFMGFFYPAFGQFMYTLAKTRERSGGGLDVPLTVRMVYGGGIKASEYHSESTESYLVHTPGVRVVCPSGPREAKGLLAASIRHDDPVVFMEHKKLYRTHREAVPDEPYTLSLEEARLAREGEDVTVVTWGGMVRHAETAADRVDADVEIVDLRVLSPLDVEAVLESVRKTGRCVVFHEARRTLGLGAEITALVTEYAFPHLLAPVRRATGYDVHFPGNGIEDAYLPDADRAAHAIEAVVGYEF
jgi:pyruvate dehydrogenase E1 component beta subunit